MSWDHGCGLVTPDNKTYPGHVELASSYRPWLLVLYVDTTPVCSRSCPHWFFLAENCSQDAQSIRVFCLCCDSFCLIIKLRTDEQGQKKTFFWSPGWQVRSPAPSYIWLVAWQRVTVVKPANFWKVQRFQSPETQSTKKPGACHVCSLLIGNNIKKRPWRSERKHHVDRSPELCRPGEQVLSSSTEVVQSV